MLTNPIYLFALAGLSIPVAIHLLSRKEGKVVKLGSVRHVLETSTQQFKGIKLNELLLLALRCAMIVTFSLLLSGLQCSNPNKEKWVLVEKGVDGLPNLSVVMDSLEKEGYALHRLAPGFPALADSSGHDPETNYWTLMDDLKSRDLSQAIIFSKNKVVQFKGKRLALPAHVRWISQEMEPTEFPLRAVRVGGDSVSLREGHSDSDKTSFITKKTRIKEATVALTVKDTVKIALMSALDFKYDARVIKAALRTIETLVPVKIQVDEGHPSAESAPAADWGIWLSSVEPTGLNAKQVIRISPQASNELLIHTAPKVWMITQRLNEEVALHHHLTMQLATLLLPQNRLREKLLLYDRRMLSDSMAWRGEPASEEVLASTQFRNADRYLVMLLLALLLIERLVAYQRNQ